MSLRFARLTPLLLASACGQTLTPISPGPGGGAGADMAAAGGSSDGGGNDLGPIAIIDMAGFNVAGSPAIVITAPAAGAELAGDKLVVTATITSPTSALIASGSAQITITPPGGMIVSAPMSLTAMANVYRGTIDVSAVPSGMADFTVSAADITGKKGSATSSYVHDHGPTLTFVNPTAMTAHGTVNVEIIVDDPLHPVTMLSQVKAGIRAPGDITLTQVAGAVPFRVVGTIDLNSFTPTLDGTQVITASATNSKGTQTSAQKQFIVDNAGPTIVIKAPAAGAFVGGVVEIQADVSDLSMVNDASVVAVFGGNLATSVQLTRLSAMSTTYHGFFDVRSLGTSYVLPELSVRADDQLGNHGEVGQEIVIDNVAPWMTMDSGPQLRVAKFDANKKLECSNLFSPLGDYVSDGTAYEGAVLQQIMTLRARIEDHGNYAPGLTKERYSGIDATSVTLYALPATAGAVLAVDTNGDSVCDDINPTLIPTSDVTMSGEALAVAMAQLAQGSGTPDYRLTAGPPPGCAEIGDSGVTVPPDSLCPGTGMTYILPYSDAVGPIWSIGPVSSVECVGFQLDSLNHLPEGPTCIVARAVDKAGNQNVSYPLHVCIDRGGGKCSSFTYSASDCTGTWSKAQQKLVPGMPCIPPKAGTTFPTSGEIRDLTRLK